MARFIAGAICPACGLVDKLFIERNTEGENIRNCVACGFSDSQPDARKVQNPWQSVRISANLSEKPAKGSC